MKLLNAYRGLPRSIYYLFMVNVINRFGDFVFPFLSLLLTQKLKLSCGVTGLIVMTASLVTIPAALIGGRFADKVSRKKTYIVGQTLAAVSILICSVVENPPIVVSLLILAAFFNGFVRPTISAMVADLLPPEKRQAGSSLLYLGINVGVSIGTLVAGFLFNHLLPLLFIGDAVTSFIAVAIVFFLIGETKPKKGTAGNKNIREREEKGNLLQVMIKRPQILCFLTISIIYSFVYRQCSFSLPIMMDKVFGKSGSEKFGSLMSVNAITVLALSIAIVGLTKKFLELTNMIIAVLFYAVGFGMIGLIGGNYALFIVSTVLWTIGEILSASNKGVYVANNSPQNFRARFSSVESLFGSLGGALGTSLTGAYMDHHGVKQVWNFIFVVALIGAALTAILKIISTSSGGKNYGKDCETKSISA